jgi:hypothetical protein
MKIHHVGFIRPLNTNYLRMKKFLISILLLGASVNATFAQFGQFKELIKDAKGENDGPAVTAEDILKISNLPQQKIAKAFFDKFSGSKWAYITSYYSGSDTYSMKMGYEWKPMFGECDGYKFKGNTISADTDGNVSSFGINYKKSYENQSCYTFSIIHPTGAYAFGNEFMSEKYVDGTYKCYSHLITFFDNFIIVKTHRDQGKFYISGEYYLVGTQGVLKQILKTYKSTEEFKNAINPILQKYYDDMQVLLKSGDQKMEEEKRAKYGIKGKDVVSLAIEPSQYNKVYQGQAFNFDIIATLKDGTKLSTRQGFKDEYDIQVEGLELVTFKDVDGKVSSWYEIARKYIPKNDKISIIAKSKFHPNVKPVEFSQNVDYENCEWTFNDNGDQSNSEAYRKSAGSYRVEVKSAIDLNTKKECYEYKVWNKGEVVAHFKQVKTKPIVVNAKGGNGKKPNFGKQNGGNGGSITLVKDPSAKDCKIIYDVSGGVGYTALDANGAMGTYTEIEQKLNW